MAGSSIAAPVADFPPRMRAAGRLVRAWRKRLRCVCSSTLFGRLTKVADPLRPILICCWQSMISLAHYLRRPIRSPSRAMRTSCLRVSAASSRTASPIPISARARWQPSPGSRCVTCKSYLLRTARPVANSYIRFVWIMPRAFCIAARHWEQASHLARSPTPVAFATIPISPANFASGSVTRRAPQRGTRSRWRRHSARRYR